MKKDKQSNTVRAKPTDPRTFCILDDCLYDSPGQKTS